MPPAFFFFFHAVSLSLLSRKDDTREALMLVDTFITIDYFFSLHI